MLYLTHLLGCYGLIFICSAIVLVFNLNENLFYFLIVIRLFLLSQVLNFMYLSLFLDDFRCIVFGFILFAVASVEFSVGLSLAYSINNLAAIYTYTNTIIFKYYRYLINTERFFFNSKISVPLIWNRVYLCILGLISMCFSVELYDYNVFLINDILHSSFYFLIILYFLIIFYFIFVKFVTFFMAGCLITFIISETIRLWVKATLTQQLLIVIALAYQKIEKLHLVSLKFILSYIKYILLIIRVRLLYMKSLIGYYSIIFVSLLYAMLLLCMFLSDMLVISTVCTSSLESTPSTPSTPDDIISLLIENFNKFYENTKILYGFTNLTERDHKKFLLEFLTKRLVEDNYHTSLSSSEIQDFTEKFEKLNNARCQSCKRGGFLFLLFGTNAKHIHSYFSKVYRNPSLFGVVSIFVYLVLAIIGAYFINYFIKTGADNLVHYLDTCISQYGKYGARSIEQSIYAAIGDFSTFECMFLDDCCISWSESRQRRYNLQVVSRLLKDRYKYNHYNTGSIDPTDYGLGNIVSMPLQLVNYCLGGKVHGPWPWFPSEFDEEWDAVMDGTRHLLTIRLHVRDYSPELYPQEIAFIDKHCSECRNWYIYTRSIPFFGCATTVTSSLLLIEFWPSTARVIAHFIVDMLLKLGPIT